jgi:hypothetical protein
MLQPALPLENGAAITGRLAERAVRRPDPIDRALPALAAAGYDGSAVEIGLRSGPVTVIADLDYEEHRRRSTAGVGPIIDRSLLTALWELPDGMAVERSALPRWVIDVVGGSSSTGVVDDGTALRRMVRPPLRVRGAVACRSTLRASLAAVCRLSALCPVLVVVDGPVDPADPTLLEADLYGVGVVGPDPSGTSRIVSPAAPVTPTPGPFLWWISELAYGAVRLAAGPAAPML